MKISDSIPHITLKTKTSSGEILRNPIPVTISKQEYQTRDLQKFTHYIVKNGTIPIGHVNLSDTPNGVLVSFIRNYSPEKYSGFGTIADQIEVEHCLKRGLKNFKITSEASLGSHIHHYKRGKRFSTITDKKQSAKLLDMFKSTDVNKIINYIIKFSPEGKEINTSFLGSVPMYMPQKLIKKYIDIIKKHPLIK